MEHALAIAPVGMKVKFAALAPLAFVRVSVPGSNGYETATKCLMSN